MSLDFAKDFKKALYKLPKQTQGKFLTNLSLFTIDPFDPSLRNHALTGNLTGVRSISITGDVRAHYKIIGTTAVFIDIGTHTQLYK